MSTANKEQLNRIEKEQWENWLHGENDNYIKKIRQAVNQIHEENAEQKGELPFYTPHGPIHCKAVEDLIHRLLPNESYLELDEKERFFLLAAAWLHDLGMERIVAYSVWQEHLNPSEIRKRHHITSAKFITSQNKRCGVEEEDKGFLSQLCRFHRKQEDLANCPEELMVGQKPYRLRMLAAYLRLADALHVDHSRAPASSYAVCLAYNISTESKLHWIKSRLVSGINIIPDKHVIRVEFKVPCLAKQNYDFDVDWLNKKIDYIIGNVLNDTRTELSSVINVLTRAGPTHYLDVEEVRAEVFMDDQTINDLFELIMNFNIVGAPSASKLVEMILITATNIAGYHLKKGKLPNKIGLDYSIDDNTVKDKINEFIQGMSEEVLKRRPCHLGLKQLLDDCQKLIHSQSSIDKLVESMDKLFQRNHNNLLKIRQFAKDFFKNNYDCLGGSTEIGELVHEAPIQLGSTIDIDSPARKLNKLVSQKVNVLLYGYSETVIEALCGFRDALIGECVQNNLCFSPSDYYGSIIEDRLSEKFRIFICEGNPKTQTAYGDRLMYHDGIEYSKALRRRRFRNIIILPDIVVGNVIKNQEIHYFLVGANGLTKDVFKHSAGHESIVNIINYQRDRDECNRILTKIVLVASSEKYEKYCNYGGNIKIQNKDEKYLVDGYTFWKSSGSESVRSHIWIGRDKAIYDEIHDSEYIMFYNPREDNVSIRDLDWIISDLQIHPIGSNDPKELETNIKNFEAAMESANSSESASL